MNIHDGRKKRDLNKKPFNLILFYYNNKNIIKKLLLILVLLIILIFPEWSGNIIAKWINEFFGTILKNIKN